MKNYKNIDFDLSFDYPENWIIDRDGNIINAYNPSDGVGALQISSFGVGAPESISLKDELSDYIRGRHSNFEITVDANYVNTAYLEGEDQIYWRYFLFLKEKTLIFITYNCEQKDIGLEDSIINQIVLSTLQSKQ